MQEYLDLLLSVEGLAIIIPLIVFIVTIVLVIKRLANFLITLLLLTFALVSGLAIINYDALGAYIKGDSANERIEELQNALIDFKDQLMRAVNDLKDKVIDDQEETEQRVRNLQSQVERLNVMLNRARSSTADATPAAPDTANPEVKVSQ